MKRYELLLEGFALLSMPNPSNGQTSPLEELQQIHKDWRPDVSPAKVDLLLRKNKCASSYQFDADNAARTGHG